MSNQDSTRAVDTRDQRRTRITAREQHELYKEAAHAVITEYVRVKQLPRISASNFDPDTTGKSVKLGSTHIEFLADVEAATETCLKGRSDLQQIWFKLALHEPVDRKLERECVQRCGRVYVSRRLEPHRYFYRDKYIHRSPR